MHVRKIGKLLTAAALALGLAACSSQPAEPVSYNVLCPTGAPALATLGAQDVENTTVTYTDGTDALTAELAKKDGEYDVIVAPVNLGAKIYEKADAYQLEAVVTWGNLYIVGTEDKEWEQEGRTIALFGENAVPGLLYNDVLASDVKAAPTWYNAVSDAQQALLAGKADMALLAQPAAAATIAKAKENGTDLKVIANLQELWTAKQGDDETGYPQAAVFVKKGSEKNVDALMSGIETFIENANTDSVEKAVEAVGADSLGVPNAQIAAKTWDAQNIRYVAGANAKDQIQQFLGLFQIDLPDTLITE